MVDDIVQNAADEEGDSRHTENTATRKLLGNVHHLKGEAIEGELVP